MLFFNLQLKLLTLLKNNFKYVVLSLASETFQVNIQMI